MPGHFGPKAAFRERLAAARAAHGALTDASAQVCRRLSETVAVRPGMRVLGYAATRHEVSIDAALLAWLEAGAVVCLPWVEGRDLRVGAVTDLHHAVAPGWRDVREPTEPRTPVAPHTLDVVVVPGVGFDPHGARLGYGGGHFDRLLAQVRSDALVVGVALDEQVVDRLPTEAHDRSVDLIVTPTRIVDCGAPRL